MRFVVFVLIAALAFPSIAAAQNGKKKGGGRRPKSPAAVLPDNARSILENATTLELYSLDPSEDETPTGASNTLYGWKVLGKVSLKKTDVAGNQLVAVWKRTVTDGKGAKCFDPRHAIHAEHDGRRVDVLICFHCRWAYVYNDGKEPEVARLVVDRKVEPELDKLLKDAKVPLAKKPE